ncbi:MAG: succinylglutamate desuccinylase/aspartoacylase family protein, partial [Planctomycetales bacterium]|nr:succinylglutamate desuccinylase/aspartoacylase family protein [Planctomycetales bacterium]
MMELRKSVLRGQRPGPKCLITAGVHGDEFEGILATLRLLQVLDTTHLSGTVTLVPVVNELALEAHARCGPDGLDLARSCPGKRDGAPTEQVAAALSELIQAADYYIDLHSGGRVMD